MSLLDILRLGVKIANDVTKPVQATVSYQRITSRDAYGAPATFASLVPLAGIVEMKSMPVRTREGTTGVSRATIDLLDVAALVAATSGNGPDYDDIFVLPDGSKGPVISLGGFVDAGTAKPIATTVILG